MSARVLRIVSASVDGIPLDLHRASFQSRVDARGRSAWELTGWTGPIPPELKPRLVSDARADVIVETTQGTISGVASVSLMAVTDASGMRMMVRIWSEDESLPGRPAQSPASIGRPAPRAAAGGRAPRG